MASTDHQIKELNEQVDRIIRDRGYGYAAGYLLSVLEHAVNEIDPGRRAAVLDRLISAAKNINPVPPGNPHRRPG
jgi:hypothetical protein